jgi:hypothetical protein
MFGDGETKKMKVAKALGMLAALVVVVAGL